MRILLILPLIFAKHTPIGQVEMPFVRALCNNGWDIYLLCSDRFIGPNSGYGHIIYVHETRFIVWLYKICERLRLSQLFFLPDYVRFSWNRRALRRAKEIVKSERISFVLTSSFPSSTHLIGLHLKQSLGVKWIANFYDPWCDNPHLKIKSQLYDRINRSMERSIAVNADVILHTNNNIIDLWKDKYSGIVDSKIYVLPIIANPIAEELKGNSINKSTIVISHIGNLYKDRSAEPFIIAITKIKEFLKASKFNLSVFFVGNVFIDDLRLIHESGLDSIITCTGQLTEEACAEYYYQSDILLAIDGSYRENFFFPSKLIKYYYSKKPILGITTSCSVLEKELTESGHYFVHRDDIEGIVSYLKKVLSEGTSSLDFDKNYYFKFQEKEVMSRFDSIVIPVS